MAFKEEDRSLPRYRLRFPGTRRPRRSFPSSLSWKESIPMVLGEEPGPRKKKSGLAKAPQKRKRPRDPRLPLWGNCSPLRLRRRWRSTLGRGCCGRRRPPAARSGLRGRALSCALRPAWVERGKVSVTGARILMLFPRVGLRPTLGYRRKRRCRFRNGS